MCEARERGATRGEEEVNEESKEERKEEVKEERKEGERGKKYYLNLQNPGSHLQYEKSLIYRQQNMRSIQRLEGCPSQT